MLRHFHSFLDALAFLTVIRTKRTAAFHFESCAYYPLVGGVIGCVVALTLSCFASADLAALVALIVWVVLTGALHLDGLADTADAVAAAHRDKARYFSVARAPDIGAIGVVAIMLVLLCKWVALSVIASTNGLSIIAVCIGARALPLALLRVQGSARDQGLAATLADATQAPHVIAISIITIAIGIWLTTTPAIALLLLGAFIAVFVLHAWLITRLIGGAHGDSIGASIEVFEALALVCIATYV